MSTVELISNVSHYYYTALSLHRHGYLGHYITGPSLLDDEAWLRRLGGPFERLWRERRLAGIPAKKIKRAWLPEISRRIAGRLGVSGERTNQLHNELFAREAEIMASECDVLHFVHSVGWRAARHAKRQGAKVICDMREEHPRFQEKILSEEAERLGIEYSGPGPGIRDRVLEEIDLADYIFCPSSYARRTFLEQGVRPEQVVVCPYGVDPESFGVNENPRRKEPFTILFLGRVCMRKGLHYLLEGFREAGLGGARLILAGPVDSAYRPILDQYQGLFEETGAIPHPQVREQYLRADVFVMPSLADSFGLVVSEAMSTGLPVIVSQNTGMADLITDGREGFIVPIRDSRAIADKLTDLYQDRERCASMGRAAIMTARKLDWNTYQGACGEFYESLFGKSVTANSIRAGSAAASTEWTQAASHSRRGERSP